MFSKLLYRRITISWVGLEKILTWAEDHMQAGSGITNKNQGEQVLHGGSNINFSSKYTWSLVNSKHTLSLSEDQFFASNNS